MLTASITRGSPGLSRPVTLPVATRSVSRVGRVTRMPRVHMVRATHEKTESLTGVVFQPFREVAPVLKSTSSAGTETTFCRNATYTQTLEAAVNEQINVEYNISYVYHAMSAYFSRDNVSLHGIADHFRTESDEEKGHAQKLMDFQSTRGGRVKLNALVPPESEYAHAEKGDALYAFELALALEKLNFEKLLALWEVANSHGDAQATTFLEDMVDEQARDVKKSADYVAQLRRVGKGHGAWHWDRELAAGNIGSRASAPAGGA